MKQHLALAAILFSFSAHAADLKGEMAKDAAGSSDSSLIGRFEGAKILGPQKSEFDQKLSEAVHSR